MSRLKLLESSYDHWRAVAETQAKDLLSLGTGEVSSLGMWRNGGFFHADRLLWMVPGQNGLPPFGYCRMRDLLLHSIIYLDHFLLLAS